MPINLPYSFQNLDTSGLPDATDSDGDIIGKAVPASYLDANFEQLAKVANVGGIAPSNPYAGMLWLDTSSNPAVIKVYSGAQWISVVSNADTVDTYHASQTPTANTIPVALSSKRIAFGYVPEYATYSKMTCGTSAPSSPAEGELFYHTTNKTLQKYIAGSWYDVDWQTIVKASPEWIANRLRIQSNQLQISPDGSNWYNCIPAVGASAVELASVDNTNYTLLYWISPGTTVIVRNANHLPIVYAKDVEPAFTATFWTNYPYDNWIGLRPSGVAISDGDGQFIRGGNADVWAERVTQQQIVPIADHGNINENWGFFSLNIRDNQRWLTTSIGHGGAGYVVQVRLGSGTAPATSYWLGTWWTDLGFGGGGSRQQFTMTRIALTRHA